MMKVSGSRPHPRSRPLQKLPPCRGRACPARSLPIAARTPSTAGPDMSGPYRSITRKAPAFPQVLLGGVLTPPPGVEGAAPLQKLPPCRGRACPARGLPIATHTPSITGPDMSGPYRPIHQKAPAQPRAGAFLYPIIQNFFGSFFAKKEQNFRIPVNYSIPSRYPWGTTSYASAR